MCCRGSRSSCEGELQENGRTDRTTDTCRGLPSFRTPLVLSMQRSESVFFGLIWLSARAGTAVTRTRRRFVNILLEVVRSSSCVLSVPCVDVGRCRPSAQQVSAFNVIAAVSTRREAARVFGQKNAAGRRWWSEHALSECHNPRLLDRVQTALASVYL